MEHAAGRRPESTRDKLFRATLEVAAERGLAGVSTHRVAAAAGLTTGAIYRNFAGRDHLIRETMAYYQRHVSDFDVPSATSIGEWAHGYVDAYLDIVVSQDQLAQRLINLQRQLMTLRETDSEVRAVVDEWQESRFAALEERINELASASGDRTIESPRALGLQLMVLAGAFCGIVEQFGDLIPREVAHAAVDKLLVAAIVPGSAKDRGHRRADGDE